MIDPLETVVRWLSQDAGLAALVGVRVASKHRYGQDVENLRWATTDAALTVRLDGGTPDLYAPVQAVRLEVRCYAPSQQEALQIWARLVGITRETDRQPVLTSNGPALLYSMLPASGASMLYDREISLDFLLAFLDAQVCEEAAE